jgi:hypothetical protein
MDEKRWYGHENGGISALNLLLELVILMTRID